MTNYELIERLNYALQQADKTRDSIVGGNPLAPSLYACLTLEGQIKALIVDLSKEAESEEAE